MKRDSLKYLIHKVYTVSKSKNREWVIYMISLRKWSYEYHKKKGDHKEESYNRREDSEERGCQKFNPHEALLTAREIGEGSMLLN